MGVPKFFRWLSERYPLINQPIHCPPKEETKKVHGFPPSAFSNDGNDETDEDGNVKKDHRKNTKYVETKDISCCIMHNDIYLCLSDTIQFLLFLFSLPHIMPEFDRLYLDMNGIIHCASHNNSEEELEKQEKELAENGGVLGADGDNNSSPAVPFRVPPITNEQIFQNVCYYLDRIVSDVVEPKELVYLAIDGVAPRAKLNQQRSRRYRSGTEKEIEMHLMTLQRAQEGKEDEMSKEFLIESDGGAFDGYRPHPVDENGNPRGAQRFSGTIKTGSSAASISAASPGLSSDEDGSPGFHSNCITPGTPFLHECSQHILQFIQHKLKTDPKWKDLTIVFSGHDVPGEGEHKVSLKN